MRIFRLPAFLTFLITASSILGQQKSASTIKAVKCGRLVDVINGKILENQVILIDSNSIVAVGPNLTIPAKAEIIDLSGFTVLPGLIDCHTHLSGQPGDNYYDDIFRRTSIDYAVVAHVYAKRTLEAGFTTCRDVGSADFIDVSLRNAINDGLIPGPRMMVATFAIGATGGHADLNGFSPYLKWQSPENFTGVADGVDAIRKQVRFNIKNGADVIKMIATAGVLSEEESAGAVQYSLEEMKALVDEAHMWGKRVAAHAHGTEGIKRAVEAGVNSIEHGSILDDEAIRMMKEKGTWLVADIYNDDYILAEYSRKGYPDKIIQKEKKIGQLQRESFQKAVRAGVRIAYGTDAGVYPHGWNGKQFYYMVKYGMTPMQAIQSATLNASQLLGWEDKVGSITAGKFADIIAVRGNPLDDVKLLENVVWVIKDGQIIKSQTK